MRRHRPLAAALAGLLALVLPAPAGADGPAEVDAPRTAARIYEEACATCHGPDGKGARPSTVAFGLPLPDFTDCNFAVREPDVDWLAVTHEGGPARGFSELMPAFGEALTDEEVQKAVDHLRSFCPDRSWPRGEQNLPKAMFTEKAFPEDELYVRTGVAVEDEGVVDNRLVYEKRFGARNQFEVTVPFSFFEAPSDAEDAGTWRGGVNDVALGLKRVLLSSVAAGSIASVTAEVVLPTGNSDRGFGKGTAVFEPFLTYGQIVPAVGFLQLQGGVELPFNTADADNEWFARAAVGRSIRIGRWGRTVSPMVEVLTGGELVNDPALTWDLVPQVQVTLNARQNIMFNLAVRLPLTEAADRSTTIYAMFLWDWFDGGLLEGW